MTDDARALLDAAKREEHRARRSIDKVSCPACGHAVSRVVDSRGVLRLRVCDGCAASYLTSESAKRLLPRGSTRISTSESHI